MERYWCRWGGGGAGGQGGLGGTGGWGGGSSFGLYLVSNGPNTSLIDCQVQPGTPGAGGSGGPGGMGGSGGIGGSRPGTCYFSSPCNVSENCDVGNGGRGGNGGNGGNGGPGGDGQPGIAHGLYLVSGTSPTYIVSGTASAINAGPNDPPSYNFAAEPIIRVNGFACTNKDYTIEITSGGFNQWISLGPGATATVPNASNPLTYQYTSVGRKTIVVRVGGVDYTFTEYIGILLPDNQIPALTANPTGPICQGSTATFSGDLTGVSYEWELIPPSGPTVSGPNAQVWPNVAFTQPGTYTIRHRVYTDCCGWTPWVSTLMEVHPQATVTVAPPTPQICYGDQVTLTATITPPGSTVLWSPAIGLNTTTGTTVEASPTATTTYTVLVIPPLGSCVATENVTVTVNPLPDATASVTPASCGNNGSATLTITAGAPPVSAVWNTTPPQTGLTATNLQPGIYTATLTDANGCTRDISVFVPAPPGALLAWLQNSQSPSCFGQSNGSATIGVSGGTPPYSYSWSHNPLLNAPTATGLTAGNYTVTVQDNAGCTFTVNFSLSQPAPLTIALDPLRQNEPVSCSGACNGVLTVEADGGTLPYTYTWSSSTYPAFSFSGVNTAGTQVTGLCEGEYTITVTDANGCTASITVQLGVTPLTYTLSKTDALCYGAPQGSASVTIGTAHSGTTWHWTGPGGFTSAPNATNITGLIPGRYYIHFTIPGCPGTVTDFIDIDSPPDITITPSHTMPLCNGQANGSITVTAGGGVGGYSYNINGGPWGAASTFTGLAAGVYTLGVQDANGCIKTLTYTLPEPPALGADVTPSFMGINVQSSKYSCK